MADDKKKRITRFEARLKKILDDDINEVLEIMKHNNSHISSSNINDNSCNDNERKDKNV